MQEAEYREHGNLGMLEYECKETYSLLHKSAFHVATALYFKGWVLENSEGKSVFYHAD